MLGDVILTPAPAAQANDLLMRPILGVALPSRRPLEPTKLEVSTDGNAREDDKAGAGLREQDVPLWYLEWQKAGG